MDIFQALIYGIVQGIGEFLPISSTAHLDLLPWVFGWAAQPKYFDMALHFGTAFAVIAFFFKDWLVLIKAGFTKPKSTDGKLFWLIALATIPGSVIGLLLNDVVDFSTNYLLIGIMLIAMGIVLYFADKFGKTNVDIKEIGVKRGLLIGISQALAIIPGVSRSGITMSTGRFLGLSREGIARFTFLMSAPIILADALYQAKDMLKDTTLQIIPFVVAVVTAAVVGLLSIKFLLNYLKTKGFGIFVIYRFVLGAFVIILYFVRG